jgi:hypothetical protein
VQGAESTQTQYYQTYHQKRLLSGNISRNPPFKFDYFAQVPILDSLITLQTYGKVDEERRTSDRATAPGFVSFYDIRYVVVAPGVPGRPPYVDTRDEAVAYLGEVLPLTLVYDQDDWLLYRVNQPALPSTLAIDFGSLEPVSMMAQGEGWAAPEQIQGVSANWAVSQGAQVFVPSTSGVDYALSVDALPFDYSGAEAQAITPEVNGHSLERQVLASGWGTYSWRVPAGFLVQGLNDIRFGFDRLDAPVDVLPGNGIIGSTGVRTPTAIEVNSGGPENFAFITLGQEPDTTDGSTHRQGYNLALIDPQSGELIERQGFDTTPGGSEAESAALVDFVNSAEQGWIVAAAIQGEGAAYLTEQAVGALRSIGAQADLRDTSGWSHAVIGVKGAAPGTALEAAGPGNGWLRAAPDRRTLSVAIDRIQWERLEP